MKKVLPLEELRDRCDTIIHKSHLRFLDIEDDVPEGYCPKMQLDISGGRLMLFVDIDVIEAGQPVFLTHKEDLTDLRYISNISMFLDCVQGVVSRIHRHMIRTIYARDMLPLFHGEREKILCESKLVEI